MKNRILLLAATAIIVIGFQNCKKPTENVKLNVNNSVFKNFVYVKVSEYTNDNKVPAGTKITVGGADAEYIYNMAGTKDFVLNRDGILVLAVDPRRAATQSNPLDIVVSVSSSNTLPVSQEILIDGVQKAKHLNVKLVDLTSAPQGFTFNAETYSLNAGVIPTASVTSGKKTTADSVYYSDDNTSVVLPAGTDFYYYSYQGTGELIGTRTYKATTTSYTLNGVEKRATIYVPYDTMVERMEWRKVKYTGSSMKVVCLYRNGASTDVAVSAFDEGSAEDNKTIRIFNGDYVKGSELLYTNACRKILSDVYFLGIDSKGNSIQISPSKESKWFTSYNLDPNTINPKTNQTIKDGDIIEIGVNPATNTTILDTIRKAANGQLRVETRTFNVGYFYRAPYTHTYKYTFNTNHSGAIPDIENLSAHVILNFGVLSTNEFTFTPSDYAVPSELSAKISSKTPINMGDAKVNIMYCGRSISQYTPSSNAVMNLFDNTIAQTLPAVTTFYLTLNCKSKNVIIHPDYYGLVYSSNSGQYFNCFVNKGTWKTRGVTVGQTYYLEGYVNGSFMRDTLYISGNNNEVFKELKGDEYICDGL